MDLWQWLRRSPRMQKAKPNRDFKVRPRVLELEHRLTPSGSYYGYGSGSTTPAASLMVTVPNHVNSGTQFDVIVKALTAGNKIAQGYTGTVHISSSDTTGATLPSDYTFTSYDKGSHVFHVTLTTLNAQSVTATDVTPSTTVTAGTATTTVDPAPVATQLFVRVSDQVTVGLPTNVTVTALDASGHAVPGYTGTVSLATDTGTSLGASYTFTAADHGKHTFQVTFTTPGTQKFSATDGTLTGNVSTVVNSVGPVTHFGFQSFGAGLSGFASPVQVVALDAQNHIVAAYTGTVHFSSTDTDSGVVLPADYTFTAADHGSHLFSVTLVTAGKQKLTITDGAITANLNLYIISQLGNGHKHHEWW